MLKRAMVLAAALGATELFAAPPAAKVDPVAANYPVWTGLTAKNNISGREITASDLRHKITVFIEVDHDDKFTENLVSFAGLAGRGNYVPSFEGTNWETTELSRDNASLVCVHSTKNHEAILEDIKFKKGDAKAQQAVTAYGVSTGGVPSQACPMYENVTFEGAVDTTGKRPYVYVFGPTGKEPLVHGQLNAELRKKITEAIAKAKKEIDGWDPKWAQFTGNVAPEKVHPALAKALAKGKAGKLSPLEPVAKGLLKGVLSKDEESAKAAQVQYDAIYQARSDLVMRIQLEAPTCPHRAYYDIQELLKYFPAEKKRVELAAAKIKAKPEYEGLAKVFCKLMVYAAPDFTVKSAAEAKKIMAELNKMKKKLEPLKESKNITVQNGALVIEMKLDETIALMSSKVPAK